MGAVRNPSKSPRKTNKTAQWVTFVVLFSFVTGSIIIGGLSFRSGQENPNPPLNPFPNAPASPEENPVQRWQESVKRNPKDPFAFRNLARAWLDNGDFPEARKAALEALKLSPADALNVELLGQIAAREGKIDEAVGDFKKAAASKPKDPTISYELAQALTLSGKDEEASKYYQKVISTKPDSLEGFRSRLALLNAAMYRKNFDEAKKQAMVLYSVIPGDPRLLVKLGEIAENQNQISQALVYYEKAKKGDPADLPLAIHVAELYSKTGNNAQAASQWLEIIQKDKDDPEPMIHLASVDQKLGKKDEAKDLLERALKSADQRGDAKLKARIQKMLQRLIV